MTASEHHKDSRLAGRPRVVSCKFSRSRAGRCRCRVVLAWGDKPPCSGVAEGVASPSGELRCAAEACLAALAEALPKRRFDLVGVKALRAFDSTLVVASLAERGGSSGLRLVGSVLAKRNHVPAAVKAVLHAVNRVITTDGDRAGRNDGS